MYGFQSYISVPITQRSGEYFGTLCALDPRPMQLKKNEAQPMFELFAELIGMQLEAEERQHSTQAALLDAEATAELREQFIAVLGHDIRTPLSAISSGTELLLQRDLGAVEQRVLQRVRNSVSRIARLVDDVLDFARGRLGGGIPLAMGEVPDLGVTFKHVVEEARSAHPQRSVIYTANERHSIHCDRDRMG